MSVFSGQIYNIRAANNTFFDSDDDFSSGFPNVGHFSHEKKFFFLRKLSSGDPFII